NAAEPFNKGGVDFLARHCTRCHGEKKQKAGLKLDHVRDDLALLRARRNWKEVLNMVETGQMPPEEEEQPSATERKAFLESVRAVFVRADNAPPDPGRITVRRLNRAEYNNTIR